jgi:hypothetical protein
MKKYLLFLLCCLTIVSTAQAADIMVANFEDGTVDGINNWSGGTLAVATNPAGQTGNWLDFGINNAYWGQLVIMDWANSAITVPNLLQTKSVDYDLVLDPATYTSTEVYLQIELQTSGGFDQWINGPTLTGFTLGTPYHVSIDVSSMMALINPSAISPNLMIYVNPKTGIPPTEHVFMDNIQLIAVPEPATIVLLAMSGLMAILYWRKR